MDVITEKSKRSRSVNFTLSEMRLLINLVAKRADIIENKKIDHNSNKAKDEAWNEIAYELNSSGATEFRTSKNVRKKYEAMKIMAKKKALTNQQQILNSGGEVSVVIPYNDWEYKVLSICSNIDDSEAILENDVSNPQIDFEYIVLEDEKIAIPTVSSASSNADVMSVTCDDEVMVTKTEKIRKVSDVSSNADLTSPAVCCDKENMVEKADEIRTVPCTSRTLPGGVHAIVEMYKKGNTGVFHKKQWDPHAARFKKTSKFDDLAKERLKLINKQIRTAEKELEFKQIEHELKLRLMQNEQKNDQTLKSKSGTMFQSDEAAAAPKPDNLAAAKLKLVHIQIEIAEKELEYKRIEHELRLRFMYNDEKRKKDEHSIKMNNLRSNN